MFWKRKTKIQVDVKIGKRGRWRWFARDLQGEIIAQCPVFGYDSPEDASEAAKALFGTSFEIHGIVVDKPNHVSSKPAS